jgi:hypothetical protein
MSIRLGMNAKLYLKPGGLGSANAWIELGNVKDVTLDVETGDADVTTRANAGWKASVPTTKEAKIDFTMIWDTADAGFQAVATAFFTNAAIGIAALDGAIDVAGHQGLVADMGISSFSRKEGLEDALTVDVSLKVFYSTTPPRWATTPLT